MSNTTLADIERLCWHLSGWQVEQRSVDALLKAVAAYAGYGPAEEAVTAPASPLGLEGGAGEAVSPAESPVAPPAAAESPEPVNVPQTVTQRIEMTGTLTLVCPGVCGGARAMVSEAEFGVRTCTACGREQPLDQFHRKTKDRPTRRHQCRTCEAARKRGLRAAA